MNNLHIIDEEIARLQGERAVLKQALESLERVMSHGQAVQDAKEALRAAIAEPERRPLTDELLIDALRQMVEGMEQAAAGERIDLKQALELSLKKLRWSNE